MDTKTLEKTLRQHLKDEVVICNGDHLLIKNPDNPTQLLPILSFTRKTGDLEGPVWLSSMTGVLIQEAQEFYEFSQECARKVFLENLQEVLKDCGNKKPLLITKH